MALTSVNTKQSSTFGNAGIKQQFSPTQMAQFGFEGSQQVPEQQDAAQGMSEDLKQQNYARGKRIWTPRGWEPGIILGRAKPGEAMFNRRTGELSILNPNGVDKDVVPVGQSLSNRGEDFQGDVQIPGNYTNPLTGNTFQQDVAPLAVDYMRRKQAMMIEQQAMQHLERQKNIIDQQVQAQNDKVMSTKNSNRSMQRTAARLGERFAEQSKQPITKKQQILQADMLQQQAAMMTDSKEAAAHLAVQQQLPSDENGQVAKFSNGKPSAKWYNNIGSFSPWLSTAVSLPYLINEGKMTASQQPTRQYEFTANPNAQSSVDTLASLRYDNSADFRDLLRTQRRGLYGIKATGGNLSSGQRRALANDLFLGTFDKRAALRQEAQNRNNEYIKAAAILANQNGQDYAHQRQQALHNENDQFARAVAAKQQLDFTHNKNWYTAGMQLLKDVNTNYYNNRMMDLWGANIEAQEGSEDSTPSSIRRFQMPQVQYIGTIPNIATSARLSSAPTSAFNTFTTNAEQYTAPNTYTDYRPMFSSSGILKQQDEGGINWRPSFSWSPNTQYNMSTLQPQSTYTNLTDWINGGYGNILNNVYNKYNLR